MNITVETFFTIFWYYILFDFTRYIIIIVPIIFVVIYDKLVLSKKSSYNSVVHPEFTVILAGHNEEASLEKTLDSIFEQTQKPTTIIFIDDGSVDNSINVAKRMRSKGKLDVVISSQIRSGKSAAINYGLSFCNTEFFIIADIDTTFDRNAFRELLKEFQNPSLGAVAGNLGVRNRNSTLITRLQAIEYLEAISVGRYFSSIMDILPIVSGAFGAFRMRAVEMIGGMEVGPGEDADIVDKLRRAGWKIHFAHKAWALTDVPDTLPTFTRQRIRWNQSVIRIRFRKFGVNLNPFRRPFSFYNAMEILNILFFQVILSGTFFMYLSTLPLLYGNLSYVILLTVSIFYIVEDLVFFILITFLFPERQPLQLFIYIPLNSIFRAFLLRGIRLFAYVRELIFRRSYADEYVPKRVLQATDRF